MRERVNASESALGDDNSLQLIDLGAEKILLRVQEVLERLDGSPNLQIGEIILQNLHFRPESPDF